MNPALGFSTKKEKELYVWDTTKFGKLAISSVIFFASIVPKMGSLNASTFFI